MAFSVKKRLLFLGLQRKCRLDAWDSFIFQVFIVCQDIHKHRGFTIIFFFPLCFSVTCFLCVVVETYFKFSFFYRPQKVSLTVQCSRG